jgi:hypothetical protein
LSEGDACCCHLRGDTDHSGEIDISDLIGMVDYMFNFGSPALCPEEGDVNGDGNGPDISDLVHLVSFMFSEGPPPPPCS